MWHLLCEACHNWDILSNSVDLRRHRAHYDGIVMGTSSMTGPITSGSQTAKQHDALMYFFNYAPQQQTGPWNWVHWKPCGISFAKPATIETYLAIQWSMVVFAQRFTCHDGKYVRRLSHWGRHKMHGTWQMTFSNAFSWMKISLFYFKFHWAT